MKILSVIPLSKSIHKESLSYFSAKSVPEGTIVSVPVRSKIIDALVVEVSDVSDTKSSIKNATFAIKKIEKIKGKSFLSDKFLQAAEETSKFFAGTLGGTLEALVPQVLLANHEKLVRLTTTKKEKIISPKKSLAELREFETRPQNEKLIFQAELSERISYYKIFIRESFAKKKSIFLCLPTIADIERFTDTLSKGIENYTFSFHSDLTGKEVIDLYNQVINEPHPILIIGTPHFFCIPRHDLGSIILEHESSPAYKILSRPYIDLRVFAELLSRSYDIKFIAGDTLLRFETLWRYGEHELGVVSPLSFRTIASTPIEIMDMRREDPEGNKKKFVLFSERTEKMIEDAVSYKKHLYLFALRRGLASITVCGDCGTTVLCDTCGSPLVLYGGRSGGISAAGRIFACNKCKKEKNPETSCSECGGWNLVPLGIGTELVYEFAKKNFKEVPLFRIDKEITKTALQAKRTISQFMKSPGGILIGTEMALHYLTEKVDKSIVVSFDSLFTIPSFRMSERIIQLVIGLSAYTEEGLVIQTKNPDEKTLRALSSGNLLYVYRDDIAEREEFGYPPFTTIIKVSFTGSKSVIDKEKKNIQELFESWKPLLYQSSVRGKGLFSIHATIKLPRKRWSPGTLVPGGSIDPNLSEILRSLPPSYKIQIDPEDLL